MDDEFSNSQGTNEDPTLPGSEAEGATITLTPENAEAKLALSEVVEWLHKQNEPPRDHDAQIQTRKYTWIAREQTRDAEVARLLRQVTSGDLSSSSPISSPKSQVRTSHRDQLIPEVEIWTGFYYMGLGQRPQQPLRGWTAGSLRLGPNLNDFVLCLHNKSLYRVRRHQAVLQIHRTGRVYIQTTSNRAYTYVNADRITGDVHVLNEAIATVRFGSLTYRVQYARFAQSEGYSQLLHNYLQEVLSARPSPSLLTLTPTPSEASAVKVGQWNLSSGTIGSRASGRVIVAINQKGRLVALKRMSVGEHRTRVTQLQQKLEIITSLAKKNNEDRILRLVEVITDDIKGTNRTADVWFVLEPAVADTLSSIAVRGLMASGHARLDKVKAILMETLKAIEFLHSHGWIHGDIKPDNVGIRNHDSLSVVLLDLDGSMKSPCLGHVFPADPGTGGTIGWLSPEREMSGYTETADIWSIGVIALWLIHGRHPWRTHVNPWRSGLEHAKERSLFFEKYQDAVACITQIPSAGLQNAILGMIRYPYAEQQSQRETRLSAKEALENLRCHDDESSQPVKKTRSC